ncbi:sulfite exporter TauE/SafE family protein [Frondihabitans australicus]|uniref:sulfite exporter TauE/SafE family protein n=1 Tax=Frondihabitans australicus TaxID=386892 RepID=UPI001B886CF5|nr:sulfite exporter TauE/SafE family protein [Frondihabitans australicus]
MHGWTFELFLLGAGIVAGVIGTAGGITSLVAYPALLAVGIPPLTANITSTLALLGSGAGSALRAKPDLDGHSPTLRRWMPPIVLFSFGGAVLLVVTPGGVFDRVVPFLVLAGSVILLLQPAITRWQARRDSRLSPTAVRVAGAGVAAYNGYFGAGSGILMIALLLLTTEPRLFRANSLKNVILLAADIGPAVLFTLLGSVVWRAVWPLGVGALVGGLIGPSVARRVPSRVLRPAIAVCGVVLAAYLAGRAY